MECEIIVRTEKKNIDFINKIIDGYEGIAIIRTINPNEGIIKIITFREHVLIIGKILKNLYDTEKITTEIISQNFKGATL